MPYHGYYYRILKAQGKDARGGAYAYMVGDNMRGASRWSPFPRSIASPGL